MSLTQLLIQVAARGTLLLLLTALAGLLFRRSSAATRHLIWTGGLTASLILPLVSVPQPALPVLPTVPRAVPPVSRPANAIAANETPEVWSGTMAAPAPVAPAAQVVKQVSQPATTPVNWAQVVVTMWLTGLALGSLRLVFSWIAITRLERRAVVVISPEWLATIRGLKSIYSRRMVRYLESADVATPCTWGTLSPTVLLPAVGAAWSAEERRQVVVHELAHVRRFDCATQVLATLAVALHWFNPLAWYAQRQARVAREQACDDAVLAAGGVASTYATLLLTAAAPEGGRWLPSEAQAMARRSQIGDRLLAVLDPARRRNPVDRRTIGWLSASALAVAIPVVSLGFQPVVVQESSRGPVVAEQSSREPVGPEAISSHATPSVPTATPAVFTPSVPSLPATDFCGQQSGESKESSSSSSYTDDDGKDERNWFTLNWRSKKCSIHIEGRGKITFTAAEDDVATISEGGKFLIELEEKSIARSYRVTNKSGTVERRYQVDDKDATLDEEATRWRAMMILEFIRRSGYDAEARAARFIKQGGIEALIAETSFIKSDGSRSIYLKVGLANSGNSVADVQRLIALAGGIGSDGDKASVLKAVPVSFLSDERVQATYADVARGIGSDGDKASVLMTAIRSNKLTGRSCEWVVGLADGIGSDGDRSAVLISAMEALEWNSSCVRKSLEVTREIGSDGDKAATLIRFLERNGLPEDLAPVFFATVSTIGSSGDHASVLVTAARRGLVKSERAKTLYRKSAEEIGSDGDRESAIRALDRS